MSNVRPLDHDLRSQSLESLLPTAKRKEPNPSEQTGERPVRRKPTDALTAYGLVAPAVLLMILLLIGPTFAVMAIATTDWQLGQRTVSFIGLNNFIALFGDEVFWRSLWQTLVYVAIVMPCSICLGLLIALAIENGRSLRAFYRAVFFLPVMSTTAAMAAVWETLLHPTFGLVNQALGVVGISSVNWLRNPDTVLFSLAVIGIWQNVGFAMVLFLAGLKSIPNELYDAANIDGADGMLDRLRTVTLPMLGPVTMFVVVIIAINAFQVFDTVKVLTQGGPNKASEVLLYSIYTESFEFLRTGYGAAMSLVYLVIIVVLTLIQAKILDRKVHYT